MKATGITRGGVRGLTIFSLVKPEKLSNLFEIVAKALRKDPEPASSGSSEPNSDSSSGIVGGPKWSYDTMTLPCIDFPASRERSSAGDTANPLYVTVSDRH